MPTFIRHPKDFWSGIIFLCIGLAAVIIGRDYSMGTAGRMGPAYFPTILGGLLVLIGSVAIIRSFIHSGVAVERFAIKDIVVILSAVILFGVLVRGAGLVAAVLSVVLLSSYASTKFKLMPSVLLAIGMTVFSVVIFVKLLGLPIAVVGPWFGF